MKVSSARLRCSRGNALSKALERGGIDAAEVDALFLCTCTGYLCPGVSSHLAELLGLRR